MIVEIRDEVVALSGALRRNHWPTLQSAVNVRLKHHPTGIVVDCGGLTALTPEGAETFRGAARHIAASGARIVVANVPPAIMSVIRQTPNLGSRLPLAASVAEARASLGLAAIPARRHAGEAPGTIVAGLFGNAADGHAAALACRLARSANVLGRNTNALVYLVYVLIVPRDVPLLSALGPDEEAAQGALETLDEAVRRAGLRPVRRVEHTRDAARRLAEIAGEVGAETLVLALPPDPDEAAAAIAAGVLARAPCDVLVDRLAPAVTPVGRAERTR